MINRTDLFHLEYYKKNPFTGSDHGMRYRIERMEEGENTFFRATVYPEPFAFDHTPEEQKCAKDFPFEEDALDAITDWLNQSREAFP